MLSVEAFRPLPGGTVNISANTTASSVLLTRNAGTLGCRVYNAASVVAFVEFGNSAVVANTTTSMPVASGAIEVVNIDQSTYASAVTSSGTGTVYFTMGYGL